MTKATLRCAIYTRVSSDSGLEQDFNSLDAQRESAEAYIKSQAHEGWKLVRDCFDDGGFSGGSIERPALQRLLEQIRDGRIDVVVVYKVDRLTRSLADFAKLVELFDAHKVSFVSVTQSFNTTSSMGRLTLNVLLSFAQFEREVTGERIRDKIAASKKKGLWMGGHVPLGYRVEDRKLLIVEDEANIVRSIFDLYLSLGSIPAVQRNLRANNVRSRVRTLSSGKTTGGIFLTNGPISHILRNRHYLGEINHKGKSWPGEHAPLVDPVIFQRAQESLAANRQRRSKQYIASGALLTGKIFNDAGERMSPTHARKQDVRYHYYVAASTVQGRKDGASSIKRIPAPAIEAAVIDAIKKVIADSGTSPALKVLSDAELVTRHLDRITVRATSIDVVMRDAADPEASPRRLTVQWTKPPSRRRREILEPEGSDKSPQPIRVDERARLLRAVASARLWIDELVDGSVPNIAALAQREGRTERSIRMSLSLAFLDPAIIDAAGEGKLPRGFGASRLVDLPPAFEDQWRALGLRRPAP